MSSDDLPGLLEVPTKPVSIFGKDRRHKASLRTKAMEYATPRAKGKKPARKSILTQHQRVVMLRAKRLGISVESYESWARYFAQLPQRTRMPK